jgi:hypothetical protein
LGALNPSFVSMHCADSRSQIWQQLHHVPANRLWL